MTSSTSTALINRASHSAAEKGEIAKALTMVCKMQKAYGKTPDDIGAMIEGISWALAEYPVPLIVDAMAAYVRRHEDIPTAANLLAIIDPPKPERPKIPAAMYVALQKRDRSSWTYEEEMIVKAYEREQFDAILATDDPASQHARQEEIDRLRKEVASLKRELDSLLKRGQEPISVHLRRLAELDGSPLKIVTL